MPEGSEIVVLEGVGLLTEHEHSVLHAHREMQKSRGSPYAATLSPVLSDQLYEVFLQGTSCEEIARNNPGISLGQVLEARLASHWDDRRTRHLEDLLDNAKGRLQQTHLEAAEFVRGYLTAVHKALGSKSKKFLQTGQMKDFPKFTDEVSWARYKQATELLMKLTGQNVERQQVSGVVEHRVTVTRPPSDAPAGTQPPLGGMAPEVAAEALAALEEGSK